MLDEVECWSVKNSHIQKLKAAKIKMLRQMCEFIRRDKFKIKISRSRWDVSVEVETKSRQEILLITGRFRNNSMNLVDCETKVVKAYKEEIHVICHGLMILLIIKTKKIVSWKVCFCGYDMFLWYLQVKQVRKKWSEEIDMFLWYLQVKQVRKKWSEEIET